MVRLICTDVDGTLVGRGGAVHPEVWRSAARVREAGIRLAVCSGRPGFGVTRAYAERLDPDGWHSFQTGASIVHLSTGGSRSAPLPPATVRMLIDRARATGRLLELYTDGAYAVEVPAERARAHAGLLEVPFQPRSLESLSGAIVRAQWLVTHAEVEAVIAEPHPGLEVTRSTSPLMPDTAFLNLTAAGVDKGSSVRVLAETYGVDLQHVMFVGDGSNDLSALEIVGHPVAVANAEDEVLRCARRIVDHVEEGGLAQAFEWALAGGDAGDRFGVG